MQAFKSVMAADSYLRDYDHVPRCFPIPVPLHAPLNEAQAKDWSEKYWPCIFNPAAQLLQDAPPLHLLRKTRLEMETYETDDFVKLAEMVADDAKISGRGLGLAAVVVEPISKQVIAVAGDARFYPGLRTNFGNDQGGRPEYHALMRAISMVANKEL